MSEINENMLRIDSFEQLGELPDALTFKDGSKVETKEDWAKRREELYPDVIELQYGTMPPRPEYFRVDTTYVSGERCTYRITCGTNEKQLSFRMNLVMPKKNINGMEKPPVIVDGDLCFGYSYDKEWLSAALDEGVAWALFDRTELANDIQHEGRSKGPLYEIYPQYTFGALGAWAWGYSRVVDALEIIAKCDMDNVVFTGHSRGGKTAALAGALDERAAIVNPNETCAGACGCYRVHVAGQYLNDAPFRSERLSDLWKNFDFWMGPKMGEYKDNEELLPFDCHELKAMVAPRTLFISEAAGDWWSNPVGSYMTTIESKKVFDMLGASEELFWYFRPGTHYHTVGDVKMLVRLIKRRVGLPFDSEGFFEKPFKM